LSRESALGHELPRRAGTPGSSFAEDGYVPLGRTWLRRIRPAFLDSAGRRVAVWFDAIGELRYVACGTFTLRCASTHSYGDPFASRWADARFVSNQSRPHDAA
jgi:hypothetical protein